MHSILEDLNNTSANIQASALISTDGLVIASTLPQDMDEDTFGAVSAALHYSGTKSIHSITGDVMEHIMIKSARNYILMARAGNEAFLAIIVKSHVEIEPLLSNVNQAIEKMALDNMALAA